nr:MAG: hypothetical protein [Gammatorquevirus sp.]
MSKFYKPATYNGDTREQMWMSTISDFHDCFCKCWHPLTHALACIFPEGHKDRNLTIKEIIERDLQCHSGGDGEESHGMADGSIAPIENIKREEEPTEDADLEKLLAEVEEEDAR